MVTLPSVTLFPEQMVTLFPVAAVGSGFTETITLEEALPHAFWNNPKLPESKEANALMAKFFDTHLGK